ncbi:DUF4179 domain-containing protein [Bacillus sp. JJ1773]|uniref:DUF4179 domain-containing protein n=1 Tax=Bacillus sp. JJ1773 TaxID=3122965 RepID=UPI003000C64B
MEKLQEDIRKMVNNVPVPSDQLNKTVQDGLKIGRIGKKQSFLKSQRILASIASVLIIAIGGILLNSYMTGTSTGQHAENILYNNGDEGLKLMVKEGKVKKLSLAAEDQNIKVMLEEAYLDNHQLAISYHVEFSDQMRKKYDTSDIELELFVNDRSDGNSYFSGMNTKDLIEKGDILKFYNSKEFPITSELEIRIKKINDVEGDWSFAFTLQKDSEYIEKTSPIVKEDELGNSFAVKEVQLTPSFLLLNTKIEMKLQEVMPDNSYLDLSLVAIGPDGVMYLEKAVRSTSSNKNAYDQIVSERILNEKVEVPRSINVHSYKIVPYISTYKGKEIPSSNGKAYMWESVTAPFMKGAILNLDSKIKVLNIIENTAGTVVHYEMDPLQPVFPRIINQKTDQLYEAISFKQLPNHIEVTYPKVSQEEPLEFNMIDSAYKVFSDLEINIDLKE